jgi:hypothetical protein
VPQGLTIIRQDDFSAGMFPSLSPDRIPANGFYSLLDGLVDDTGGIYKRGGTTVFAGSTGWPTNQILWVWQGQLTAGARTLFATATTLYRWEAGTITSLGAYTGMAGGANRPVVIGGTMYLPPGSTYDGTTFGVLATGAYVVSIANRIVAATGDTVKFSGAGTTTFAATDLWKIPGGVNITGLAALRDSAVVFTDQGTWVISNMALNLTDTAGNIQQRLDFYSPDMILLGSGAAGVVGYEGGLIVPARDGVWLMSLGSTSEAARPLQLLSRPISDIYQSYVAIGHRPGLAAVHRGHYFLPILDVTLSPVKVLVCRLDSPRRPWVFLNPLTAAAFAASQAGSLLTASSVLGNFSPTSSRLLTASFFTPQVTTDLTGAATPSAVPFSLVTRDYATGALNANTITKLRVGYRLTDPSTIDPTLQAGFGITSVQGNVAAMLTPRAPETAGDLATYIWPINQRTRFGRVLLYGPDQSSRLTVQSVELFVRSAGRV